MPPGWWWCMQMLLTGDAKGLPPVRWMFNFAWKLKFDHLCFRCIMFLVILLTTFCMQSCVWQPHIISCHKASILSHSPSLKLTKKLMKQSLPGNTQTQQHKAVFCDDAHFFFKE